MSSSLEVRTRAEGAVGVVELLGDVSAEGESQILQAYESETAEGRRDILIELSRAAYINTSGISVLIELAMAAKKADIHIMVSGSESALPEDLRPGALLHLCRPLRHRGRRSGQPRRSLREGLKPTGVTWRRSGVGGQRSAPGSGASAASRCTAAEFPGVGGLGRVVAATGGVGEVPVALDE